MQLFGGLYVQHFYSQVLLYHVGTYATPVSQDISKNIYVDSLISGSMSHEDGVNYYEETKIIFAAVSMNMCQGASNDNELMKHIRSENNGDEEELKVLGMLWKLDENKLYISKVKNVSETEPITERTMLICGIYDPLGLICPL